MYNLISSFCRKFHWKYNRCKIFKNEEQRKSNVEKTREPIWERETQSEFWIEEIKHKKRERQDNKTRDKQRRWRSHKERKIIFEIANERIKESQVSLIFVSIVLYYYRNISQELIDYQFVVPAVFRIIFWTYYCFCFPLSRGKKFKRVFCDTIFNIYIHFNSFLLALAPHPYRTVTACFISIQQHFHR